jgi:hypothetical protein
MPRDYRPIPGAASGILSFITQTCPFLPAARSIDMLCYGMAWTDLPLQLADGTSPLCNRFFVSQHY